MPVLGAPSLLDRLLHGFEDLVAVDALLARDRVGYRQQLRPGKAACFKRIHAVHNPV